MQSTRAVFYCVLLSLLVLAPGCVYVRPGAVPPRQLRIRLLATGPAAFNLRLNSGESSQYAVPSDGRVTLQIPGYGVSCKRYLFGGIPMGGGSGPLHAWSVTILRGSGFVRTISIEKLEQLPVDADGFRLITLK